MNLDNKNKSPTLKIKVSNARNFMTKLLFHIFLVRYNWHKPSVTDRKPENHTAR